MNYEEKYKQALKNARDFHNSGSAKSILENIFPELKEKDERIRKTIYGWIYTQPSHFFDNGFSKEEMLAWVEKQGEQTTDKVEPKFKVGDWITTTDEEGNVTTEKIIEFWGDKVRLIDTNGFYSLWPKHELNYYHIWSINDAKDGDILVNSKGNPFIFTGKFTTNYHNPIAYCGIGNENKFVVCALNWRFHWAEKEEVAPATKEQRELLFSKMKQEGYEWNAEKKELKKIEHKMLDADKVIEWLNHHELSRDDVVTSVIPDDSPTSVPHRAKWLSDEFIKRFKKDFGI